MSPRRRAALALSVLSLCALALRLPYLIRYDEDIDALRFALAVDRFDVLEQRPHAPFYPVYVAAAKLVAALGASPQIALGVVGAVSGAALVVATVLLAREVIGARGARVAAALAIASPFLWLSSIKLTSDAAGAALTTTALWLCARARRLAPSAPESARGLRTGALVLLGLELGVRLSYFPFALACLAVIAAAEGRPAAVPRSRDLAFGIVVWLVPLVLVAGPRALVASSAAQAVGHFTRWGGSVITEPSTLARLGGIFWGTWANALGGAWPDAPPARWIALPVLAMLVVLALRRVRAGSLRRHPELWAAALGYAAWAGLFQNIVHKPRHLLPLVPLLVVALAGAADEICARSRVALGAVALLAAEWLVDGAALAGAHALPSPAAAIVGELAEIDDPRPVIARELARMIAVGAPRRRVLVAVTDRDLTEAVLREGRALVTSEALSSAARATLEARGVTVRAVFARPRSRYVDPLWSDLALLDLAQPPLASGSAGSW